jgi:hypothetical protein
MDVLVRIKRAVLAGRYAFSEKARIEMETDDLTELDVAESILNAVAIYKRLRSTSPSRTKRSEYLYVIQSTIWMVWQYIPRASLFRTETLKPITFWFPPNAAFNENPYEQTQAKCVPKLRQQEPQESS